MTTPTDNAKTPPAAATEARPKPRTDGPGAAGELDRIMDVRVNLTVELGRRRMTVAEVLALAPGAVIELAKSADEPLDILVNDQLIARGEAVVVGDRYGVRITEVVDPSHRLRGATATQEAA